MTRVGVASDGTQGNADSNGDSRPSSISGDGRFVAFVSCASNLVPVDTNNHSDVFVHDHRPANGFGRHLPSLPVPSRPGRPGVGWREGGGRAPAGDRPYRHRLS
jgi:hypothetical protein